MAPAEESGELADEPGGALDGARADLKRLRRGLSWRERVVVKGGGGAVQTGVGKWAVHAACSSTDALHWCWDQRWVGSGRRRLSALAGSRSSSHK